MQREQQVLLDHNEHNDLKGLNEISEILVHSDLKGYKVYSDLLELTEPMVQTEKIEYHLHLSEHTHQVLLMYLMMLYLI